MNILPWGFTSRSHWTISSEYAYYTAEASTLFSRSFRSPNFCISVTPAAPYLEELARVGQVVAVHVFVASREQHQRVEEEKQADVFLHRVGNHPALPVRLPLLEVLVCDGVERAADRLHVGGQRLNGLQVGALNRSTTQQRRQLIKLPSFDEVSRRLALPERTRHLLQLGNYGLHVFQGSRLERDVPCIGGLQVFLPLLFLLGL